MPYIDDRLVRDADAAIREQLTDLMGTALTV
jgi:hypothetical protein